jgi:hypothetical protein
MLPEEVASANKAIIVKGAAAIVIETFINEEVVAVVTDINVIR